ncbi:MAG TPA: hypothetical protein VFI70_13075 [Nitrososphaeraceae archaeon]|nr:hypothetical protein [Nitrososphaeraceae archaeon]
MTNGKKCQFSAAYYDYESQKWIPYNCPDDSSNNNNVDNQN